jgi:hypothetical protein
MEREDTLNLHRALALEARALARTLICPLPSVRDALRLGAACVELGTSRAAGARDDRDAARGWRDCDGGDKQIRLAVYEALAKGGIASETFDKIFATSAEAERARQDELLAVRRRLIRLALV